VEIAQDLFRASESELFYQPMLVVSFQECADRNPQLFNVSVCAAVDNLFFESFIEPLHNSARQANQGKKDLQWFSLKYLLGKLNLCDKNFNSASLRE